MPVRVLIRPASGPDDDPSPSASIWERMYATSRPFPVLVPLPASGDGEAPPPPPPPPLFGADDDEPAPRAPAVPTRAALLADVLHSVAPALFPAEVVARAVEAAAAAAGGGGQAAAAGLAAAAPSPVVLVGGVCPPLSCPLAWLHARMCGPDAFLYVVVRCRPPRRR